MNFSILINDLVPVVPFSIFINIFNGVGAAAESYILCSYTVRLQIKLNTIKIEYN